MSETIVVPDNGNNNNGWNSPLGLLALGNGGLGGWGNGLLGGGLGAGIGAFFGSLVGNWFGGNGNGFGWNGGNGNAAAASLGAQATANNNTDLLMNAINGTDADVRLLATTLNADINKVQSDINAINLSAQQVGASVGLTGQQVINAIQAGNMTLAQQLAQCCCDMRQAVTNQGYENQLRTIEQTNTLGNAINGVQQSVAAKAAADQLAMCQQTYNLTDTMNRNYIALDNKLDAMESGRKDREITALTAKVAQLESQNFTTGVISQAIAPVNAQLASLAREVDDIKCKQPSTVSVQYPNLVAMNATPYINGGFYGNGFGYYGNGFGNGITF